MLANKNGYIIDIDGTLLWDEQPIPGVIEAVTKLKAAGKTVRFATNSTGSSPEALALRLQGFGIPAEVDEVETSVTACQRLLKSRFGSAKGQLVLPQRTAMLFDDIEQESENPEFIMLGDLDDAFNNILLNALFLKIRAGAQLIVFHKNLYFRQDGEFALDSGAYTHALEKATGKAALVTGKPSSIFFDEIINGMALPKDEIVIVGDDLSTDILGAANTGVDSVLVKTGKFASGQTEGEAQPTLSVNTLLELV